MANKFKVKDKRTNKIYNCFVEAVDLNFNGRYVLRYNIGIENYTGWHNVYCVYENDHFNDNYEVIEVIE